MKNKITEALGYHCLCAQSCPALCDPMDCIPLGSTFHRIFQARYWCGLPFPPPGDLPDPGIPLKSPVSPASAGRFFTTSTTWGQLNSEV